MVLKAVLKALLELAAFLPLWSFSATPPFTPFSLSATSAATIIASLNLAIGCRLCVCVFLYSTSIVLHRELECRRENLSVTTSENLFFYLS